MPQQFEVRVIFECDRRVLDRIGTHEDEEIRREQREMGLINHRDEMTIFGLYVAEHVEEFVTVAERKAAKRRMTEMQRAEGAARRRASTSPAETQRVSEEIRAQWIARRDAAPVTPMTKSQMARATGVSLSAIQQWSKKGIFRGKQDSPREVLTRYLVHRYGFADSGAEIRLSQAEERELAAVLAETGV